MSPAYVPPVACGQFLLPNAACDMRLWPVVACDQYTAQPDYWRQADALVGGAPSTLRLILPEAYLPGREEDIAQMHSAMQTYLDGGPLTEAVDGMVLVERQTLSGTRPGIVLCVDLERYDYRPGSLPDVRPTEGTVTERIPPRLRVRQGAPLELSHVLLLIDDPGDTVIEPLYYLRDTLQPLYDTPLMLSGGRARGWAAPRGALTDGVLLALRALRKTLPPDAPLIAVGDGNHSLATAYTHWLRVREGLTARQRLRHPARFAMAELENLHCDALRFEPIHRLVFDRDAGQTLSLLPGAERCPDNPDVILVGAQGDIPLRFTRARHPLPVGALQMMLDERADIRLDYIHGEEALRALTAAGKGTGLLLPALRKSQLFPAIAQGGVLPRKTFSMGEAHEKRYYIEARRIV